MKKLWARVGMGFEVSDEDYVLIKEAIENEDPNKVSKILFNCNHCVEGDSYLPSDCDDNPNENDFDF